MGVYPILRSAASADDDEEKTAEDFEARLIVTISDVTKTFRKVGALLEQRDINGTQTLVLEESEYEWEFD